MFTDCVFSSVVNQNPTNVLKNQDDSVEIYCQHNYSSHTRILWYKQTQGRGLTLLAYLVVNSPKYEDEFETKVELFGDANAGKENSIKIKQLSHEDSAVYYCATSLHSATDTSFVQHKP